MIRSLASPLRNILAFCQGKAGDVAAWIIGNERHKIPACLIMIFLFGGCYGFSTGFWRSEWMGLFIAFKLPLLLILTVLATGMLNGMAALILGCGLTFRQSFLAILSSYAAFALILGSLAPLTLFLATQIAGPTAPGALRWHSAYLLLNVFIIAYAGIMANVRLYPLLAAISGSKLVAAKTLLVWLANNLFVGAQLSWNLRPFFGSPQLKVEFLRANPFDGTFYESVFVSLQKTLRLSPWQTGALFTAVALAALFWILNWMHRLKANETKQNTP